jgi:ABC-type bacteriocin/lantibiotic exporter with double-glycine peptidase domain
MYYMEVLFEKISLYLSPFISYIPFSHALPEKTLPIIALLIFVFFLLFVLRAFLKAIILIPILIIVILGYLWLTNQKILPSQTTPAIMDNITEQFNI